MPHKGPAGAHHRDLCPNVRRQHGYSKVSYSRESESEDWTREVVDQEYDNSEFIASSVYLPVDVGDAFDSFRIVGIEDLDGSDVYHVSGQFSFDGIETGNTISYWIGVDDLLLYRNYVGPNPNDGDSGDSGRQAWLTILHSFNQDFNIQPPPDDDIAN